MNSKSEKLIVIMSIEVLGRPKEHLIETLEELSLKVNSEKGVKMLNKKINEPILVPDQKDLFTAFVELEFEIEDPMKLAILTFKYMPSHIEVLEPENFIFKNANFNELLNELTGRLHRYEELVRVLQMQMQKQGNPVSKKEKDPEKTSKEKK